MLSASRAAAVAVGLAFTLGCGGGPVAQSSGAFTQRGYLWQRDWNPTVALAFSEANGRLDGVVVLGGEVVWDADAPRFVGASVEWDRIGAAANKPVALALRIAPYSGLFADDDQYRFIVGAAQSLARESAQHRIKLAELQLDFDCPQRKLAGYRAWVKAVAAAIRPVPLVITALPAWLDEPEFENLIREADSYVLQVHSIPTRRESGHDTLCDPELAKKWVTRAARFDRAFEVALPTYRCLGGYDAEGKLLGVAMDSVQPSWPAGTRVLEFKADADAIARLMHDWQGSRPTVMRGVIWYRVPVERDLRNWRWPTLGAVMQAREPAHKVMAQTAGDNPVDVALANNGEAEEEHADPITIRWRGAALISSDALPGWNVRTAAGEAVFTPDETQALRLLPGERRAIGWLRYDRTPDLQRPISASPSIR